MKPFDPRLLQRSRTVRRHLVLSVVLGLASAATVIAQAVFLAVLVARVFDGGGRGARVVDPAVCAAAALALRGLLRWAGSVTSARAAAAVKHELRTELSDDLLDPRRLGPRPESARVVTLLGSGLDAFDAYVGRFLPQAVLAAVVPGLVVLAMLFADPLSALIVALTLPLAVVFMALIGVMTRDRLDRRWQATERLGRHFADVLDAVVLLKAFGRRQEDGLRATGERHRRETVKALRIAFLSSLVLELVATLSVALVAVDVGLRVVDGHLSLTRALIVLLLAPEAFLPVRLVGSMFHDSTDGAEAAQEVLDLLDHPRHWGTLPAPDPAHASLVVDAVTVWHPGRAVPALSGARLVLRPGETVAVTGPSGSGKSTLLAVLAGFVLPTTGRVLVAGQDLADVDVEQWRQGIAWVPQVPSMVPGTVADNVRLAVPTASAREVASALADAGASDLALTRSVTEGAGGLSAGERRRIAVARALLRARAGASLVLLDEPTAGLDAAREATVVQSLRALDATVVVVAHRPETIALADREVHLATASFDGHEVSA